MNSARSLRSPPGASSLASISLAVLSLVPLTGCQPALSQTECLELLDRYVELLVESDNPDTAALDRFKLKAEARTKANRDPAFAKCSDRVSRSQFDCAMKASNPDGLEQCLL